LRFLTPIADALDTAHRIGLVHRDVKPQNILLSGREDAYLADFGVAKRTGGDGLTAPGGFVGSFNYAAPEQALGEPTGPASDVYAFAAIIFQCLTGEVPYPRDTEAAVLIAHVKAPVPQVVGPDAGRFNAILSKGLAKDPAGRYDSAGALMSDVTTAITSLSSAERGRRPALRPARSTSVAATETSPVQRSSLAVGDPAATLPSSKPTASRAPTTPTTPADTDLASTALDWRIARPLPGPAADRSVDGAAVRRSRRSVSSS
jgi:serine/threonine-protein kinase